MYQPYQAVPTRIISGMFGTATVQQRYIAVRRKYSFGTAQRVEQTRINRQAKYIWYGEYTEIQVGNLFEKNQTSSMNKMMKNLKKLILEKRTKTRIASI